jgi:hypothetical protein
MQFCFGLVAVPSQLRRPQVSHLPWVLAPYPSKQQSISARVLFWAFAIRPASINFHELHVSQRIVNSLNLDIILINILRI